jgi:DNA-binding beta-propeller fold protein YncE
VSDAYVALIDLTQATPSPSLVQLAEDLLDPPSAEEIEIAPDGSYAFVRQFGADEIVILDLVSFDVDRVAVGFNPTDLDITPDGLKAVVVSRGSQELWVLETADPWAEAEVVQLPPEYVLGSLLLSPDGSTGVLYTTATLQDRYATWDIATGEVTVRGLVKPVQTMTVSPTGESLLVFHTLDDAEDADSGSPYFGEWAMTLMDLDDFRSNPMKLAAEPTTYAHADDGEHGFFIMEGQKHLVVLDYTTLLPEDIELKSEPVHVGTLPTTDFAYASQGHDLGRISFYDSDSGSLETITGFELNSEIEHD